MGSAARSHVERACEYARAVVSGEIAACKWVRLACERQLTDLERWKDPNGAFVFRQDKAEHICRFISLLPHVKGEWARRGEHIELQPWQCFILTTVFGWYKSDGTRRFRTVYIEVPRKNAKSTLSSGVALYMLSADGEHGAEVYSAATTRDQARIVFDIAQQMARREPEFRKAYGVEVGAHNIHQLQAAAKFEPLSADASSLDGLNVHCGVIDELHAHRARDVFDVIETATGSRRQPLIWTITTAGTDRAGICYEQRTYVTKLLERVAEDDSYFGIIYTIDDTDQWVEPATWRKANPNYGVSVYPDDLERKVRKAMTVASAQNNVLTKHLNVWVNADTAWMDMRAWERCGDNALTIEQFAGQPCWIGLDLASKLDIAALKIGFVKDGHYFDFGRYYLPEDTVEESSNSQYSGWVRSGRLIATPGNVTDFEYIKDELRELKTRFQIVEVAFDPFQATQLATELLAEGFPMLEVGMTVRNLSEPMKQIEALVLNGKWHHDGDPVMTWMVSNVVCHIDAKENIFPRKERPENKIDGVVASLLWLGRVLMKHQQKSIYNDPATCSI